MCLYKFYRNGTLCACGHCDECKRAKAHSEQQIIYDNIVKHDTFFLTFTYDDDTLPLAFQKKPYLTKESFRYEADGRRNSDFTTEVKYRSFLNRNHKATHTKCRASEIPDYEVGSIAHPRPSVQEIDGYTVAPTLNNKDLVNCIKTWRQEEKRKGFTVAKYYGVGEYGPQTSRPHYHLFLFGGSLEQALHLVEVWQRRYGHALYEVVSRDSVKSMDNMSRYLSGYLEKGSMEIQSVKDGLVDRPRKLTSTGLIDLPQREIDWYTGKDLGVSLYHGPYKEEDLEIISKRLMKKQVGNNEYRLSEKYRKRLFYTQVKKLDVSTGEFKIVYQATPLQKALTAYLFRNTWQQYRDRVDEFEVEVQNGKDYNEVLSQYYSNEEVERQNRKRAARGTIRKQISKSRF